MSYIPLELSLNFSLAKCILRVAASWCNLKKEIFDFSENSARALKSRFDLQTLNEDFVFKPGVADVYQSRAI